MVSEFKKIIPLLVDHKIEFVLVGGLAAIAHGAARATYDVDVVYARNPANFERIEAALKPLNPYLRGAPPGLPFRWDVETLRGGLNFTLTTSFGDLDLLGEIAGGGTYEQLLPYTVSSEMFDVQIQLIKLEKLIQLKRAAGRPKDLEALSELVALLEERDTKPPS